MFHRRLISRFYQIIITIIINKIKNKSRKQFVQENNLYKGCEETAEFFYICTT